MAATGAEPSLSAPWREALATFDRDLSVAGESARFGYPPARVWGVPEAPWVWVARLGLERAKRYLFTGDELTDGFVLDGFPRTESQAIELERVLDDPSLNTAERLEPLLKELAAADPAPA